MRRDRQVHPKTWFLTRDRALINATTEVARSGGKHESPLCFSVLGFLQSISPFVSSTSEENVLGDFFSGMMSEQVFVSEKLFDDRELALMAEMHSDVMAMPPDQLVVTADYIKKQILRGERYRPEEVPAVALELRKFLSANAEEKQRRLEQMAAESNDKLEAARQEIIRERSLRQGYEGRLESAEDALEKALLDVSTQREENEAIKSQASAGATRLRRLLWTAASVFVGIEVGLFGPRAAAWFGRFEHLQPLSVNHLQAVTRLLKIGLFVLPLLWLIPRDKLKPDLRTALCVLVIIGWLWLAGVQSSNWVGEFSNVATVALYFVLFVSDKKG